MSQHLFPSIGSAAAKADDLSNPDTEQADSNEDGPLQEIESLCMKCGEQVCYFHFHEYTSYRCPITGNDPDALDIHPILP
jgi:hypothetical protein